MSRWSQGAQEIEQLLARRHLERVRGARADGTPWLEKMSGLVRFSPMPSDHVIVASTTDSEDAARVLAAGVVEARLGACAQIVGPITSVYRWEGEVQTEREWRVEIKTATDRVAALTEHIKANHSYDVPEIIATPITGGSADYLSWLVDETRG